MDSYIERERERERGRVRDRETEQQRQIEEGGKKTQILVA